MKITVILCTHNRCRNLRETLESLAVSQLPAGVSWEVLVVDNNSRDQTNAVVEDFCHRYPGRFRYLCESRQGKTFALNAGIREAAGEILAFTDDDVIVERTWLHNLTASLYNDTWAGASGRTLPEKGFSPPPWLPSKSRYALAPLALFDRGSQPGELAEAPFGNNSAYRKVMFEKHGGFRNDLGPHADSQDPQKSEDSEFGVRLLAAGEKFRYEASAVLYHSVPRDRIQKKYFQAWWFDKARADIRAFGSPRDTQWYVAGIPAYFFRRILVWTLRWFAAFDPSVRFECKLKVWGIAGSILECYRMSHETKEEGVCHVRP